MAKAVFTSKPDPAYDNLPEERYHFPRTYLNQVGRAVGDMVVYYEPRRESTDLSGRAGRQAYFAAARVSQLIKDPTTKDHFYALVDNYLEFDHPVPFRESHHYYEGALQKHDGTTNRGAFGRAVRLLPDHEFEAILSAGFSDSSQERAERRSGLPADVFEEQEGFERTYVEQIVSRPFRDAKFSKAIATAYEYTCAVTGLKIINGGGRPEIEAAHIQPVGDGHNGPDSVRNGLALSRTVHWMFDRGLISISDDHRLLTADGLIPKEANRLFLPSGAIHSPDNPAMRPHPKFLHYHREHIFKG